MKISNPLTLLISLLIYTTPQSVQAQQSVDSSSLSAPLESKLEQLKAQLWSAQANSSVWQQRQDLTQTRLRQVIAPYNPSVDIAATGWRSGQREQTFALSQPVDVWGQRKAQQQVLSQQLDAERLRQSRYQAEFEVLFNAHVALVLNANRTAHIAQQQLQLQQEALIAAQQRFTAGAIAQVEVQRIGLQVTRLQNQHQQTLWQQEQAAQQFLSIGSAANINMPTSAQVMQWRLEPPVLQTIQADRLDDLMLAEAQQNLRLIEAQQRQLHTQARGNPTVSLGMQREESNDINTSNTRLMLGVSMPINLFRNNLPQQFALQTQLQWQVQSSQQLATQRQRQVAMLSARNQQYREQLQQFRDNILPATEQVRQKTWLGFKAGKFSLLDAQQAQRDVLEAIQMASELESNIWQVTADLAALSVGWEPERLDLADPVVLQQQWSQWQQSLWSSANTLINNTFEMSSSLSGENP